MHFTGIQLTLILFGAWLGLAAVLTAVLALFMRAANPRPDLESSWIDKARDDGGGI